MKNKLIAALDTKSANYRNLAKVETENQGSPEMAKQYISKADGIDEAAALAKEILSDD